MWKYRKLQNGSSPLAQLISLVSSKDNIRFVIYHLGENHVEMATEQGDCSRTFQLDSSIAREMLKDGKRAKDEAISNGMRLPQGTDEHALLAFDVKDKNVFLIQTAPELQVVSAILMGMVTELMSTTQAREYAPQHMERRIPSPTREASSYSYAEDMLKRDAEIEAEARAFARKMASNRKRETPLDDDGGLTPGYVGDSSIGLVGGHKNHIGLI